MSVGRAQSGQTHAHAHNLGGHPTPSSHLAQTHSSPAMSLQAAWTVGGHAADPLTHSRNDRAARCAASRSAPMAL